MATNGSFTTNASHNRSLTFSWTLANQSIAENYSTINWTVKGSGSSSGYVYSGNFKVVVNGSTVYSSATRIKLWQDTVVASGSVRISHNSDGTKTFSASCQGAIYDSAVNCTGSGSWTLTTIPRWATITEAPNFNDEQNPTIKYKNSAQNSVTSLDACISFTGDRADVPYRAISKTGSSYTFNLTTAERNTLRNSIPNAKSRTVLFVVRTVIGGNTYTNTSQKTMTIVNGNPTFSSSNISYKDVNTTTTAVTGNDQQIVQSKSSATVTLTSATANKGASISSYKVVVNGVNKTSSSSGNFAFGSVNASSNVTITATVTDSRGLTTSATKTMTMLSYSAPSLSTSLTRLNNYEDETHLKVTATHSSLSGRNALTLKYKYKENGGSYGSLTTITSGTDYTLTCDKEKQYIFYVTATDSIGTTTTKTYTLSKGKFPLYIDTGMNAVGVNAFPKSTEALRVGGGNIVPEGHIIFGGQNGQTAQQDIRFSNASNSTNPHNVKIYGGNPNSTTAIGVYDVTNDRYIFVYDDGADKIKIRGEVLADFVIERGTSGIWTYEKWYSGKAVCYGTTASTSITNYSTVNSFGAYRQDVNFPSGLFYARPVALYNGQIGTGYCLTGTNNVVNTTKITCYGLASGTGSKAVIWDIYAVGRWK